MIFVLRLRLVDWVTGPDLCIHSSMMWKFKCERSIWGTNSVFALVVRNCGGMCKCAFPLPLLLLSFTEVVICAVNGSVSDFSCKVRDKFLPFLLEGSEWRFYAVISLFVAPEDRVWDLFSLCTSPQFPAQFSSEKLTEDGLPLQPSLQK